MPGPVATDGTLMMCDFGVAPAGLIVEPAANILNIIPIVNIPPFVLCESPMNPEVIALTLAALGVPTPAPCLPIVVDPWVAPSTVLMDGMPVLTEGAFCECLWGGTIDLIGPSPAFNVEVE
jgi:hypothetical protein